jgi:two-component system chemotaxis sensor kinase CheA
LVVNRLLGQQEVAIKSLGNYLGNVPGIAGSTIMGDGRVALIVDPSKLIDLDNKVQPGLHQPR